ncbi:predicted protein [Uncinocarpus reesii 1704]|uniref:Uncharacterized protein n=1 Tax=Uncinocarpus reesii (strain UAMH 1704) TaxID=336963 RepID=C4K050_UNCRE|nr:uncharacterized protein UREG_07801 [Uncinocarpus reesii 1704]EEP82936.1 predicted protein [Uncinocarpus reesii 1704]
MAHESNSPPSPQSPRRRRSSFTELFQRQGNAVPPTPSSQPRPIYTSGIANAPGQQHQRRMSLNTLGLSGSPTQVHPFGPPAMRRGSVSSSVMSTSPTIEQAVVEEPEGESSPMTAPATPFARRVSFGTQALRGNSNGTYHSLGRSQPSRTRSSSLFGSTSSNGDGVALSASTSHNLFQNVKSNPSSYRQLGEGFNWAESLRIRAERAPSVGNFPPTSPTMPHSGMVHQRSASVATMEAPPPERMEQAKQPQPRSRPKPDYFQEKILRADFMD